MCGVIFMQLGLLGPFFFFSGTIKSQYVTHILKWFLPRKYNFLIKLSAVFRAYDGDRTEVGGFGLYIQKIKAYIT